MGLDMYLTGDKFHAGGVINKETGEYEPVEPTYVDGFKLSSERLELGYWRKNAPLHVLMVNRFANGKDDCQPIDLGETQLRLIATILRSKGLPTDEQCGGFSLAARNGGPSADRMRTRMRRYSRLLPTG